MSVIKIYLFLLVFLVPVSFPFLTQANEGEYEVNLSLTMLNEENINRGFFENDVHDDQRSQFVAGLRSEIEIDNLSAFFISVNYMNESYSEFDKLSSNRVLGRIDYIFQTGLRFTHPSYTLSLEIEEGDYDSELRDSTTLMATAKLLKRFTTRIKVSTGLSYSNREADTNVFDIDTKRVFALLDYTVAPKVSLYASYAIQDGASVSTITTTDPDLLAQQVGYATINEADAAGALLPDDAFGGVVAGQFAYQNQAETSIGEVGVNYSFNSHHAFDVSVQSVTTKLDTGLDYDNYLIAVSYLGRF